MLQLLAPNKLLFVKTVVIRKKKTRFFLHFSGTYMCRYMFYSNC